MEWPLNKLSERHKSFTILQRKYFLFEEILKSGTNHSRFCKESISSLKKYSKSKAAQIIEDFEKKYHLQMHLSKKHKIIHKLESIYVPKII